MIKLPLDDTTVAKILNGEKTQIIFALRPHPFYEKGYWRWMGSSWSNDITSIPCTKRLYYSCPYGRVGESIYVKESFAYGGDKKIIFKNDSVEKLKWRNASDLPASAIRLLLNIKHIKLTRITYLTEDDAKKQGYKYLSEWRADFGEMFWDSNPWVWVINFNTIKR